MDMTSFALGYKAGAAKPTEGVDPYYMNLAMALVKRDASYLGDPELLDVGTIKDEDGLLLGGLSPYALAGYDDVTGIKVTGMYYSRYEFAGCKKLRVVDVTVPDPWPAVQFVGKEATYDQQTGTLIDPAESGVFRDCPMLEAIVVRPSSNNSLVGAYVWTMTEIPETACVYIPREHLETMKAKVASDPNNISTDRYLALEDHPEYDLFFEKYTVAFYDADTLLKTQTVRGGTMPTAPTPTKAGGYEFDGWEPELKIATEDMVYQAKWKKAALSRVTTVSRSVSDVDINRDGTRMIVGLNNSEMTSPVVYDLTGEEPVQISTPINSSAPIYGSACSYDHTGNYFYLRGNYSGNGRINMYHASNSALYTWGQPGTGSYMRCSPVADILAVNSGAYNKYTADIRSTTSLSNLRNTSFKSADGGAYYYSFSCDGVYIAVGYYNGTATIHKVSDGSLVKNLGLDNVKWVSYNGDGSKLAVSFSAAPWAAVYDTATGEKLFDLSNIFSSESRAEYLIGTNLLVAGSGTTVKAFDTSGNTLLEVGDLAYAGGSISLIKSNQSGTHVAIYGGGVTEVWKKA